jgi:hypothetical protein
VTSLQFGRSKLPLGDYLTSKLHEKRGGDVVAAFRESRARLMEHGIEYTGWIGSNYLERRAKSANYACTGHRPNRSDFDSDYYFHLAKSAGKRFRIENLEKVFRKSGGI